MKHSILLLLLFTLTAFFQTNGQATGDQLIGKKMTFQGSLFQNGEPFDGTAKLKFTIALDSSSWTESHESVTVINGLYSVVLGQFTSLPNSLFYYTDERTVRVEVDNTVLGNVKLYAPFASRSASDNKIELFDQKGLVKAEMSVWSGQGFLNVDGPDDRSNAILSGNYYDAFGEMGDSSALNHGIMALFGPASGSGEPDHLRLLAGSRGDGSANDATPFLEMKAVDQTSGELKNMANLLVTNSRDSTNASTFKRGQLNLSDTRGRTSNLRSDQLYFFNPLNTQYPAGWYGTIGGSGFTQQVGYDEEGTITGAVLTGFWDRDHPGIWIEDKDANMGVFLSTEGGAGMLQLNGPAWNPNIQMGAKHWENSSLPFFVMRGESTVAFVNDNGTPDDASDDTNDNRHPDLIWMDVQKWDDGTEVGNLTLRGTDGSEFHLNSHGIDVNQLNVESKTFKLQHLNSDQVIADLTSIGDGGQLNIKGLNNIGDTASSIGGGVSLGGKFWEGAPQLGYFHLRGTVNEANYFNANLKFTLEAMADGNGNENAEFRMYSPELDDASTAKSVLRMSSVTGDNQHWTSEITGEGSFSPNFTLGAKTWEVDNDGSELPFFKMNGSFQTSFNNDNGTPDIPEDDFEDMNFKDLIWMSVDRWGDGSEVGSLNLSSTDGAEFRINAHGISGLRNIGIDAKRVMVDDGNGPYFPRLVGMEVHEWLNEDGSDLDMGVVNLRGTDGSSLFISAHGISSDKANFDFHNGNINLKSNVSVTASLTEETDQSGNTYNPSLVAMEVHDWSDANNTLEMGVVNIHGSDGSSVFMSAHNVSSERANLDFKNGSLGFNAHRFTQNNGEGDFYPSLVDLVVDEWGDDLNTPEVETDKDVATLMLRSSDGAEFGINAYGFTGSVGHIDAGSGAFSGLLSANNFSTSGGKVNISEGDNGNGGFGIMNLSSTTGDNNRLSMGFADAGETAGFYSIWMDNGGGTDEYALLNGVTNGPGGAIFGALSLKDDLGNSVEVNGYGDITASGHITADSITANVITQTSDARFKKNVKSIDNALAKTNALNGYTYYWNELADKKKGITSKDEQVGVLAQELEAVFPQLVSTDKEGYKSVNYSALSAVLIEAVKELNAEVKALKAENVVLKAEVGKSSELESRLAQIEKLLGVAAGNGSNANNK